MSEDPGKHEFSRAPRLTIRSVVFGVVAGGLWSLLPGIFTQLSRPAEQAITVLLAGVVTGVLITLALSIPLKQAGVVRTTLLGILALPFSAFLFGVLLSVVQ